MKSNHQPLRPEEKHYDRISALYDILDWPFEHFRYRALRPGLCAGLKGRVLEAGVGTGHNLAHYGKGVKKVTGIDLSRGQLTRAALKAKESYVPVELIHMDATELNFPKNSFDACLSTFLFCVLPDELQEKALREIVRVVKPGGIIRLLEYRYSEKPWKRFWMHLMAPLTEFLFSARFDRKTPEAVQALGKDIKVVRQEFLVEDIVLLIELKVAGNEN